MSDQPSISSFDLVQKALRPPLSGWPAQSRMLPIPVSSRQPHAHPSRASAVLAALYPRQNTTWLVLTRRSDSIRRHRGQISLPGGAQEPGDVTLWHTALREAHEEIGLPPERATLIGALTPLYIASSNFVIHPFLAWVACPPPGWTLSFEVAEIIELPLETLESPSAHSEESWQLVDRQARVPHYRYGTARIWGATAMILSELEVILAAQRPHVSKG